MVGARSAVFAAVPDLGVIVIDEEHDASYKHESDPAVRRPPGGRQARPHRGRAGRLRQRHAAARSRGTGSAAGLALPARIGGRLPAVEVVDLRRDGGYPFTRPLLDALGAIEDGGGRAILLQNRRGAAAALHCRTCARSWRCPRCDVALSLHGRAALVCHHCGHARAGAGGLPGCGSVDLARIGAGTERVEADLVERFPRPRGAAAGRRRRRRGRASRRPRCDRFRARRPGGAGRHADRRQGPRRARRGAGRGARRRDGPGAARLPRRGADVRAADAAGRPARGGRATRGAG